LYTCNGYSFDTDTKQTRTRRAVPIKALINNVKYPFKLEAD